jgi:hypothetical protein
MIDWVMREAERRRWSDKELAKRAGIPHSSLSVMIAGKRGVLGSHWVQFLTAFGLDLRRGFNKLGDFMDDQAAEALAATAAAANDDKLPVVDGYVDDGKLTLKKKSGSVSDTQQTSRPPR